MYITKQAIDLKESYDSYMGEFGRKKKKQKKCNYIIVSQVKETIRKIILKFYHHIFLPCV